jgi:hypothetical protein
MAQGLWFKGVGTVIWFVCSGEKQQGDMQFNCPAGND